MTHEEINEKSLRIAEHLFSTSIWQSVTTMLCFVSMAEEVITDPIIKTGLREGKTVALPRLRNGEMDFHIIPRWDIPWDIHSYGMKEPPASYPIFDPNGYSQHEVLMVTPGLGFDQEGGRLGRGGGFYDKYLDRYHHNLLTFAVCFHFQLVEWVPTVEHDCSINGIITEKGVFPSSCCPPGVV